jgi:hypothetical protein
MIVPDLHPETGDLDEEIQMPIRGLGWVRSAVMNPDDALDVTATTDLDSAVNRPDDDGVILIPLTDPESFTEFFIASMEYKNLLDGPVEEYVANLPRHLWMIDTLPWRFGTPWAMDKATTALGVVDNDHFERVDTGKTMADTMIGIMRRWFLSFTRLTWQRLVVAEDLKASRAERRRWERAGKPLEDGYMKVLQLRRRERPLHVSQEDEEREWTLNHRIIVRGHWRRQWYSSMGEA